MKASKVVARMRRRRAAFPFGKVALFVFRVMTRDESRSIQVFAFNWEDYDLMEIGFLGDWFLPGNPTSLLIAFSLLFVLGIFVGILNVVAGGGSFLTLPLLIFLGLPPSVANGTNRVGIFFQNLFAVGSFHRHKALDWQGLRWAGAPAAVGAPLGTWLALSLQEAMFQKLLAFLMVGITLWTLWNPQGKRFVAGGYRSSCQGALTTFGFFLIGVYGGFVQAGVGFLILAMTSVLGLDLVRGNGVKVLTVLLFTSLSLLVFIGQGKVHWPMALALAAGTVVGGLLGVRLTILKGNEWLRHVVTVVVIAFALRLWFTA